MIKFERYTIALLAITKIETMRFLRIWQQTLIPPVVMGFIYLIMFGQFFGKHIPEIHHIPYSIYVIPGLIIMGVINNSYINVATSLYGAKFQRHLEELLLAPIPYSLIVLGYIIGGTLRGSMTAGLILLMAQAVESFAIYNIWFVILFIILVSLMFSLVGLVSALSAKKIENINGFQAYLLTPLIFFGGVFYAPELLSSKWAVVAQFDPIYYIINLFKYGYLGIDLHSFRLSIVVLCALLMSLYTYSVYKFRSLSVE